MNDKNYMYLYIGGKNGFVEKHLVDNVYFVKNKCCFHLLNDPDDVVCYVALRKVYIVEVSLCMQTMAQQTSKENDWSEKTDDRNFHSVYCKECGARLFDVSEFSRYHLRIKCRKCNKILLYIK